MAVNQGEWLRGYSPRSKINAPCRGMAGTEAHALIFTIMGVITLMLSLGMASTWQASRAKKVRLLEDQVVSAVRAQRERADQVETKLAEWQVTIQGILAEVEEFFERTTKERKRILMANNRAADGNANPVMAPGRAGQIAAVRAAFEAQR